MMREAERRRHKRHDLACPTTLVVEGGKLMKAKTINISDGGAYIALHTEEMPRCEAKVAVRLSLPRKTANSFMFEDIAAAARIIRSEDKGRSAALAIEFDSPMKLDIEV